MRGLSITNKGVLGCRLSVVPAIASRRLQAVKKGISIGFFGVMDYPEPCAQNFIHLIMGPRSECLCCRKESSKGHGIRCTGEWLLGTLIYPTVYKKLV